MYRNGAVMSLKEAVENRKTLTLEPVISSLEHITEVLNASVGDGLYIGLFIQNTNETYLYWSKLSQLGQTKFSKIILKRPLNDITGYVFLADQNQVNFLSLCKSRNIKNIFLFLKIKFQGVMVKCFPPHWLSKT